MQGGGRGGQGPRKLICKFLCFKVRGKQSPCSCIRNAIMLTAVATKSVIFNLLMPIVMIMSQFQGAQTLLWT